MMKKIEDGSSILRLDSYYEAVVNPQPKRRKGIRERLMSGWSHRPGNKYSLACKNKTYNKQRAFEVCKAAADDDLKLLNSLLDESPNYLNVKDGQGLTPLHHACKHNSDYVVPALLQRKSDLDAQDTEHGETPLHLCVIGGHCLLIELLVKHGASTTIKNKHKNTPLHLAVQLKRHDCLKALLKFDSVEADAAGEYDATPLHMAAAMDDAVAARILLDRGAYMCTQNAHGLTSIHFAAKNASKNVLNLILDLAEEKGYSRPKVLSFEDKYKHSPLHAAINSGNPEPVRVCLEAGARIDCKQEDGSTAVHLVCSQPGALQMLKLMKKHQAERFLTCLTASDKNGMTPLHRAALFDFADVADFLIQSESALLQGGLLNEYVCFAAPMPLVMKNIMIDELDKLTQGSPVDTEDCNGKTPLLAAASRQCWCTMVVLYKAGANPIHKDVDQSNFLHLAIKSGGDLTQLFDLTSKQQGKSKCCPKLLNHCDRFGCTPLHYASKAGNLSSLCGLLEQGAHITYKDNSKSSPLHFACKYGRVNTARCLLETAQGSFVINESNFEGKTPLHLAAEAGHVKVVALLMQRGSLIHRDYGGNTPLHLAAKYSYTQTMKLMLNVHPSLLNTENGDGNTPLHEAAIANKPKSLDLLLTMGADILENKEQRSFLDISIERSNQEATLAVVQHDRWKEILQMPSKILGTYTLGLVRYLPDVLMAALDQSTECSEHDSTSQEYSITYHFDLIRTDPDLVEQAKQDMVNKSDKKKLQENEDRDMAHLPLSALLTMVKYERVQCLSHPVCLEFVQMKWTAVGFWLHLLNLLIYGVFLACFTSVIILVGSPPLLLYMNSTVGSEEYNITQTAISDYKNKLSQNAVQMYLVLAFAGLSLIMEIVQIIQQRWRYFTDLTNYIEWCLYTATIVFAVPHCLGYERDWAYNCGVVALFFSWINLLLFLQRFEFFGIYVVMFKEILATLLQVLIVFSILLFAFGVTFYALLRNEESSGYTSVPLAIMSSVVMMVGDMNYVDNFVSPHIDGDPTTSHFSGLTFFVLSLFLLLIPILLMNLLIGLAVGDIEGVQKNARLKRLATQVELVADMEKKLPMWILRRVDKEYLTVLPNHACSTIKNWYNQLVRGSDKASGTAERDEMREQLQQQKNRLKTVQSEMKSQTELLKLIVAKMEIQTESSFMDEGFQDESTDLNMILKQASKRSGWRSRALGDTLKQTKVLASWSKDSKGGSAITDTLRVSAERTGLEMPPIETDDAESHL